MSKRNFGFVLLVLLVTALFPTPLLAQTKSLEERRAVVHKLLAAQKKEENAVAKRYGEAKRKQIFKEAVIADRKAMVLIEAALDSSAKKPGQSSEWAYRRYRLPVAKKYTLSLAELEAVRMEGMRRKWPIPPR